MSIAPIVSFSAKAGGLLYVDASKFHAAQDCGSGTAVYLGSYPGKYFFVNESLADVVRVIEQAQREAFEAQVALCLLRIKESCKEEQKR